MTKLFTVIAFLIGLNLMAQTPCENGSVNGYPCNQIDFFSNLSNVDLAGENNIESNDIWGWTDPQSSKEYVLIGQTNGVVFVDISDLSNPIVIGRLPSHTGNPSSWRDVKVYKNHAYVVADGNPGHGMQVFDLTRLRNVGNTVETFENDAHYDGVSSAHNVVINEETGFAYIVGARGAGNGCGNGGLHVVDIQEPQSPAFVGCFDQDGYTHDAQCVIYNGPDSDYQGEEICFNANENTITIANVSDKNSTTLISKQGYPGSAYSHQGWLTEDQQYFISNDELDEYNTGAKTRTLVWDVSDLDNPVLITQYFSERNAIDHNLYTKDDMIFQSNYTNGLIILDSKRISNGVLRELAFFDTFPQSESNTFDGTWSNYPYFESGVIAVSDINNGLFLLKPNIKEIVTEHPVFTSCETTQQSINVTVDPQYQVDVFQWQAIINNVPTDLENDDDYAGVNSSELTINSISGDILEAKFRCKVQLSTGEIAYSYPSNNPSGLPEVNFSYNRSSELTINFSNRSQNADSVVWDFGDGSDISNEENPTHVYDNLEDYTVSLTAFNDCGEQSYSENLTVSILDNKDKLDDDVKVYPNPVNNVLKIEPNKNSDLQNYRIIDSSGKTVFASYENDANSKTSLNTSNWEKGVYLVLFTYKDNSRIVKKVIKN